MLLHRLLSIPVCLLAAVSAVNAQENLTLADATARALAKNHAIRIEHESVAAADAQMAGAFGAYDPQLKLELSARHHRDPITSIFSGAPVGRSEEHTSELQSLRHLVCRLLLEKKKQKKKHTKKQTHTPT